MSQLSVKHVDKSFGDLKVLSDISLDIGKNSVVGLLGPNGAGKTTLMRIITGYLKADRGRVEWQKKLKNSEDLNFRQEMGYLAENNPLYGPMTVREYLMLIAELKGVQDPKWETARVITVCGLKTVWPKKIEELSRGFRQRVGLAAALTGDPKILILDEPTSGLDPKQIVEVRSLIKKMAGNKIVIFSTHILPEARSVCDRLVMISRGRIVLDEMTAKIKNLEKKFIQLSS